jgi:LuxR family quorum-sensing system transcriptional regulator SolR
MEARTKSGRRGTGGQARERMHHVLRQSVSECRAITDRFGFRFFHLGFRVTLKPGIPVQVFADGGPAGLSAIYGSGGLFSKNSFLKKISQALTPFDWREAVAAEDGAAHSLLQRCRAVGIKEGVVVPLHGYATAHGMLMLSGDSPLPAGEHPRSELFREVHWSAIRLFERTLGGIRSAWEISSRRSLTKRQSRALAMAADGKGLSAVARGLEIHPSTARYLVMRAAEKLGAETREGALVRFAAAGELNHQLFPRSIKDSDFFVVDRRRRSSRREIPDP